MSATGRSSRYASRVSNDSSTASTASTYATDRGPRRTRARRRRPWEASSSAGRPRAMRSVVPLAQDEQRERGGIAADRRRSLLGALLERPPRVALGSRSVVPRGREPSGSRSAGPSSPAARRPSSRGSARTHGRTIRRLFLTSLHEECSPAPAAAFPSRVSWRCRASGLCGVREPGLAVPVTFRFAPEVLLPIGHRANSHRNDLPRTRVPHRARPRLHAAIDNRGARGRSARAHRRAAVAHRRRRHRHRRDRRLDRGRGAAGGDLRARTSTRKPSARPGERRAPRSGRPRPRLRGRPARAGPGPLDLVVANLPYLPEAEHRARSTTTSRRRRSMHPATAWTLCAAC